MTQGTLSQTGIGKRRQWLNLFEITNLSDLELSYRLVRVDGLVGVDHIHKQLNRLVTAVAYELQQPVSLVNSTSDHYLAIPDNTPLTKVEWQLTPSVATLVDSGRAHRLRLDRLDESTRGVAWAFLRYSLRGPLMKDSSVWGSAYRLYSKSPLAIDEAGISADIYPGFVWNLVQIEGGRMCVAVDVCFRYVDKLWLTERLDGGDPKDYLRRHCLYHFGNGWYTVQLWGITGCSIKEQKFLPEGQTDPSNVYDWTKAHAKGNPLWVKELDPNGPAIVYRYPGNEKDRYGALALCKLTVKTSDPSVRNLHPYTILEPKERVERILQVVQRHFSKAILGNQPIKVNPRLLEIEPKRFPIPALLFGQDTTLMVGQGGHDSKARVVPIKDFARERLALLTDPGAGPLNTTAFDAQYILLPKSLHRSINEDFEKRFLGAMRAYSSQQQYSAQRTLYDDTGVASLRRQVQAIKDALRRNRVERGYGLLVLPSHAHPDLHNYIKKELWPNFQVQCAMARRLSSYYGDRGGSGRFAPDPNRVGKLGSYVRNIALSMLVLNRKWPWALATPLHYDVYVGVDVLNGVAGVTFIYDQGRSIYFRDYRSKQPEALSARQIRTILTEDLGDHLRSTGLRPRSIVLHRDGRTPASELRGTHAGISDLIESDVLPANVVVGVVDIRKSTAENLRLFSGWSLDTAENPAIGSHRSLSTTEGVVATTGWPFVLPGTAKPLSLEIVHGDLDIAYVMEDAFALSQLVFTAPDRCMRLPGTIKISDDFLEPIAASTDDDTALYGDDVEDLLDEDEVERADAAK